MFRFNHEFSSAVIYVLRKMDCDPSQCDLVHIACDSIGFEFTIQNNAPQEVLFINIRFTDNPKIVWVKSGSNIFLFQKCGSSWDFLTRFDDIV